MFVRVVLQNLNSSVKLLFKICYYPNSVNNNGIINTTFTNFEINLKFLWIFQILPINPSQGFNELGWQNNRQQTVINVMYYLQ